jgi:hypothetical protein
MIALERSRSRLIARLLVVQPTTELAIMSSREQQAALPTAVDVAGVIAGRPAQRGQHLVAEMTRAAASPTSSAAR